MERIVERTVMVTRLIPRRFINVTVYCPTKYEITHGEVIRTNPKPFLRCIPVEFDMIKVPIRIPEHPRDPLKHHPV